MVIEQVNGDPEATSDGFAPAVFSVQTLFNGIASHVGWLRRRLPGEPGGALGIEQLDAGDPAMIRPGTADQFAPYTTGVLVVPTTNENVVEVAHLTLLRDQRSDDA